MMEPMTPVPYLVVSRHQENADTVTLDLAPRGQPLPPYLPGQFSMVYAFGVGEVPISVSGVGPQPDRLSHTVRAVGKVTEALCDARPGDELLLRGPYGNDWSLGGSRAPQGDGWEAENATTLGTGPGEDLVVVAGGVGLSPLRPVVLTALSEPGHYGWLTVLAGARSPQELVHRDDLARWHALGEALVTVDDPGRSWVGPIGQVTALLPAAVFRPERTTAFVCGPEPMMCAVASALIGRGVAPDRIRVSLERNMRCAVGWCGHCQLGPVLLCRDGPVLTWDRAAELLSVPER
jgi:anaerobic sulfite reductase subunit B